MPATTAVPRVERSSEGGRSYRRYSHPLPVRLQLSKASVDVAECETQLKDISAVALCLMLPPAFTGDVRQGAHALIRIERCGDAPSLKVAGSVLYTLLADDGMRQCVILFDGSHPEIASTLATQTAATIRIQAP